MTSELRHDPPTDPALPIAGQPVAQPEPKKRRNVSSLLSIAAVAAGVACILGATFGAGVFVGTAGHHRHGGGHHHSAMAFHQHDRGWDRDRGHWHRPDQGDRGWQQNPGQGPNQGGPGNGRPS